jgi:hypothetical protein
MNFSKFFLGSDGDMSSKRLFMFILIVCFVVYFGANLFLKLSLKQSVEDNLFWLLVITFTGVTGEQAFRSMFKKP